MNGIPNIIIEKVNTMLRWREKLLWKGRLGITL
jgi:hypothetical protein